MSFFMCFAPLTFSFAITFSFAMIVVAASMVTVILAIRLHGLCSHHCSYRYQSHSKPHNERSDPPPPPSLVSIQEVLLLPSSPFLQKQNRLPLSSSRSHHWPPTVLGAQLQDSAPNLYLFLSS